MATMDEGLYNVSKCRHLWRILVIGCNSAEKKDMAV